MIRSFDIEPKKVEIYTVVIEGAEEALRRLEGELHLLRDLEGYDSDEFPVVEALYATLPMGR